MEDCRVGRVMSEHALTQGVGTAKDRLVGSAQLSSLLGATFSGCGASRSSSFHNTERDGCLAHVVKAPCSGGGGLAHARSRAKEVPEFVTPRQYRVADGTLLKPSIGRHRPLMPR